MSINFIAEQILPMACPSIQYRLRKDMFGDSPDLAVMREIQDQILSEESVRKVMASQGSDGWLAWNFHGYDSMESGIRLLCEKGVEGDEPVLTRALNALEKGTDRLERGLGKPGKILDDLGFGGGETIRAYLFALAGREEHALVKEQTQQALNVFKFAAQVNSMNEILEQHNNRLIFRQGVCWPSIYHLRLLAWAKDWRSESNSRLVKDGLHNLVRLSPIPDVHVKYKTQVVAPASFSMHHFTPELDELSAMEWMQWFHRMELLSRLGFILQIPELEKQVLTLESMILKDHGLFTKKLSHPYFQKWGAYTGLALEKDWRSTQRRINDLTFRSLLILKYSGF